jgi:hypothetical protein
MAFQEQAAANFSLPMHQYGRSFPFQDGVSGINNQLIIAVPLLSQDGVSGVLKMTKYNDGGSLGKFFLTV